MSALAYFISNLFKLVIILVFLHRIVFMKSNYRNQWIWGFTEGAENWNGRLAMLAFIIVFLVEFFSSKSILSNLGVG